jgi:molybdopterin-guanine dinucleotide biosynthesis protein A
VLVVGKTSDGLPFSVLDDGTDSRAPIYGVVAGLRAARHDVVVALPVDVPLVTPAIVRTLGLAQAVPSERVPLPGAYPRSLLPELEQRVASGELSLRGVNPRTIDVDSSLLTDADTPARLIELDAR